MNSKTKVALVLLLVVALPFAAVYAVTQLGSNPITIVPQPTPTPTPSPTIQLTVNTTTPYIGESVRFQAVISTHQQGIAVLFYRNETLMSTIPSDSEGIAVYITPVFGTDQFTYTANCTLP
jgi:hypothetical protein